MIFDEFAHLSTEAQLQKGYGRLPASMRQEFEDLAKAAGLPLEAFLLKALGIGLDLLKEPAQHKAMLDELDRKQQPLGGDPRRRKDSVPGPSGNSSWCTSGIMWRF